jgi:glycosyltransferase involved in cell wall biosynthesis
VSPLFHEPADAPIARPADGVWPTVSVIVPAYNVERYLREALESAVAQTVAPHEIVVVDDGSTDATRAVATAFAREHPIVRVAHQDNGGPGVARNTAIQLATGAFLTFLDADDQMLPDRIEQQVGYLLAHPDVGVVIGAVDRAAEPGADLPADFVRHELNADLHARGINLMAMTAHASVFATVGRFDPSYRLSEDYQWLVRANSREVTIALVPRVVMRRRLHDSNTSRSVDGFRREMFRALREHIHERQGDHGARG